MTEGGGTDWTGKVAVVTGGSSGIGFATAAALVERSAAVVLVGRDEAKLARAAAALPGASGVAADLAREDGVDHVLAAVDERHGHIDLLFANAGISDAPALEQRTIDAAYAEAGLGPEYLDAVELHDAASPNELIVTEELGLCGPGEGAKLLHSGATRLGARVPVNPSGGLVSRGHPVGATGAAQLVELASQLRGRAPSMVTEPRPSGLNVGWGIPAFTKPGFVAAQWQRLRPELEAGALAPPIFTTLPLESAVEGLTLIDDRRTLGKIVLTT